MKMVIKWGHENGQFWKSNILKKNGHSCKSNTYGYCICMAQYGKKLRALAFCLSGKLLKVVQFWIFSHVQSLIARQVHRIQLIKLLISIDSHIRKFQLCTYHIKGTMNHRVRVLNWYLNYPPLPKIQLAKLYFSILNI